MVTSVELKSGGHVLVLASDAQGWCNVTLRTPDGEVNLGAEDRGVLSKRLSEALVSNLSEPVGEIDGRSVSWVCSLAEGHSTLYAAEAPDGLSLHFENAKGEAVATVVLGPSEREQWLEALEA